MTRVVDWSTRKYVKFMVGEDEGQGTAEYAVILGIVVVAAIAALLVFKGKLATIWTSITDALSF